MEKIVKHDSWPIQPDIINPPLLRLTSRKPLWLDLQPVDIKSRWRHNWKSVQVVNSHLVCDPTMRQPGFDLPQQQWSLLNRFHTEQGHCGVCRRKWRLTDTDLCPCGETQTMFHIVESCPLINWMAAGVFHLHNTLHSANEDTVSWLVRSFKLVTEAKHCIRQSVLQVGPNAILYSYMALCWLSIRLQYKNDFCCFKVWIY